MSKLLNILQRTEVWDAPSIHANLVTYFDANEIIEFKREMRRDKTNWFQVFLKTGALAYVEKRNSHIFQCEYVQLSDQAANGFEYTTTGNQTFNERFVAERLLAWEPPTSNNPGIVELKRVKDSDNREEECIRFHFDQATAAVKPFNLYKNDCFHILRPKSQISGSVMEIIAPSGYPGLLLSNTAYSAVEDQWMNGVGIVIMVATIIVIIWVIAQSGWLVISSLMLIPAFIVAAICLILIKILLSIAKGILHQISIRL